MLALMWALLTLLSVDPAERLWSPQDVADFLGKPVQTIYHYRSGRAPDGFPRGFRVGGAVRYDPAEIRAWLEDQRDAERPAS